MQSLETDEGCDCRAEGCQHGYRQSQGVHEILVQRQDTTRGQNHRQPDQPGPDERNKEEPIRKGLLLIHTGTSSFWCRTMYMSGPSCASHIPNPRSRLVTSSTRAELPASVVATPMSRSSTSSTTWPSDMNTTLSARAATVTSWVTIIRVVPSALSSLSRSMISAEALLLSEPVGSSPNTMSGPRIRARQIPARCS